MARDLRVAVIGVGDFGERHVAAYRRVPGVDVVAVADADAARARGVAERWAVPGCFEDGVELLSACELDAVSVAAPGAYHVPLAVAALERGAAVLLEKPIAMSGAECARLLDAAAASSGWVMPAHILRFTDPYPALRDGVRAGAVGQVLGISARRERGIDHEWRFRGVHPALMTMVHDIDLAIWISGSRAVRVTAQGRRPAPGDGPPLLLWATVEAADGSVWSLRVSWLLPDGEAIADRIEVFGADGVAPAESWGAPDALEAAIDAQLAHFCECAREGRRSDVVTLEEAAHGIAIAEAVMRSAADGGATVEVGSVT